MIALWLSGLWAASVRGGLALIVAWVLCHIPRVPAVVRCWIWRAAYAVLLISFAWTTPIKIPLLHAVVSSPTRVHGETEETNQILAQKTEPIYSAATISRVDVAPLVAAAPKEPVWPMIAFSVWCTFLAVYAGQLAVGWCKARRLRNGRTVDVPELTGLCRAMNMHRPPSVRTHPTVRGPLLVGVLHPVIVLPEPMVGASHLRLILAHELAHLRRMDLLWNWLPTLAMAILLFHPLVWICNRQWRLATEAACDAETLAATTVESAEYGRVLVNVATTPPPRTSGVLAVAVATESRWLLKKRLTMMAHITDWNRRRLATAGLIVGVFAILAAVPWRVVAQQAVPGNGNSNTVKALPPSTMPATAPANQYGAEPYSGVGSVATAVDENSGRVVTAEDEINGPYRHLWRDKYEPQIIMRDGQAMNLEEVKKRFNEEVSRIPRPAITSTAPTNLQLNGTIVVTTAIIRTPKGGTVAKVAVVVGQAVKRGDLIVQLDQTTAEDELTQEKAKVSYAEKDALWKKQRSKNGTGDAQEAVLADAQLELARGVLAQAQHELDATRIVAPFDGIVAGCNVQPGDVVDSHQSIATVLEDGPPMVEFDLPQSYVGLVGAGTRVTVDVRCGVSHVRVQAEVKTVAPMLDPGSQTQRVTAQLTTATARLGVLPGMAVKVEIDATPQERL